MAAAPRTQQLPANLFRASIYERAPLAGLALTTDTFVLTAVGNDYGYENVFSRQIAGLGQAGDVFVGISTSGRSPNIVAAFQTAHHKGLRTIGFTGAKGGVMADHCELVLNAPSKRTPIIQQLHITATAAAARRSFSLLIWARMCLRFLRQAPRTYRAVGRSNAHVGRGPEQPGGRRPSNG